MTTHYYGIEDHANSTGVSNMPEVPNAVPNTVKLPVGGLVVGGAGATQVANSSGAGDLSEGGVRARVHGDGDGYKIEVTACEDITPLDAEAHKELNAAIDKTTPAQNEFLTRLLTLDTALLGGGLVLAKGEVLPHWWAVGTMVSLFISLGACLWGLAPYKFLILDFSLQSYVDYLNARETTSTSKQLMTRIAAVAFALALAIGVLGTIAKGLAPYDLCPASK